MALNQIYLVCFGIPFRMNEGRQLGSSWVKEKTSRRPHKTETASLHDFRKMEYKLNWIVQYTSQSRYLLCLVFICVDSKWLLCIFNGRCMFKLALYAKRAIINCKIGAYLMQRTFGAYAHAYSTQYSFIAHSAFKLKCIEFEIMLFNCSVKPSKLLSGLHCHCRCYAHSFFSLTMWV